MGICKMSFYLGGKGCIIAVVLLLAGVSIVPDLGANRTFNNTIYVDDDNTEGPWDGTKEYPYQHIQDAIDAASDGDTIFVYEGIYYENVVIDKSIILSGENRESTIIDGGGHGDVVYVSADWINISGFTIRNSGITYDFPYDIDAGIDIFSNNSIISGNVISNNSGLGMLLFGSKYNMISGNIVKNNIGGINLFVFSISNDVTDNTLSDNLVGIDLYWLSRFNNISGNVIRDNKNGINLLDSNLNNITCNSILNNTNAGIVLQCAWFDCQGNRISMNTIENNKNYGVYLHECYNRNIISENSIISNNEAGICGVGSDDNIISNNTISHSNNGISIFNSHRYNISGNIISNNKDVGIYLEDSREINVLGNTITNNEYCGIYFDDSSNSIISENSIINNNAYGIYLQESSDIIIIYNNFILNKRNAYFEDCDNTWDGNYWNRPRFLPKLIFGKMDSKLSIEVDWHPAKVSNEIVSNPFAIIETNMGTMKLELYKNKMPITVENFIKLANDGFYDNLVFHRVIDDFVIQGGGYYANGTNRVSPYGPIELEIHPDVCHVDGAISMARTSDPNSATSQFFICDGKQSFLDDNYAAFGKIIVGINVLRDAASVKTTTKYRMKDWPVDDIIIESVTILNQ